VHVMEVPALFTRGSAAHWRPPLHAVKTNLPLTHCANWLLTQAFSPAVHDEFSFRVANLALRAWASLPFWRVKDLAPGAAPEADGAGAAAALLAAAGAAEDAAGAAAEEAGAGAAEPLAELAPVAPVAAMRASLSASVEQVTLVPALLTSGRATQVVPPAHGVKTNLLFAHCANWPLMHASSPDVQAESALRVANLY